MKFYYWAEEVARGDPCNLDNTLCYDDVIINSPGTPSFNPALPYVYKWDTINKIIVGEILAFVDNLRAIGFSWEAAWAIVRQIASRF